MPDNKIVFEANKLGQMRNVVLIVIITAKFASPFDSLIVYNKFGKWDARRLCGNDYYYH